MDIRKIVNQCKIKEEFKPILNSFFEMKQSVYGIDDAEMEEKIKETMSNIKNIKYTNKANIEALYNFNKNEIVIGKEMSNQIKKNGLDYKILENIFHEISHAYDHKSSTESKNQKYLVDGKKAKLKSMYGQGINPFEKGKIKTGKYMQLDECINEAKTQVLLQLGHNSSSTPGDSSKLRFNGYQELQPIFETLCSVNNMDYLEFLKNIEGKDINEISHMMSEKNGISKDKTDKYLEELCESIIDISKNMRNGFFKKYLNNKKRKEYLEKGFKDYEKVDNISKEYLDEINIADKDLRLDKLNIIKNRVNYMFIGKVDSNLDMQIINPESIRKDKEVPSYNGKCINTFNLINDSNNRNYTYKNNSVGFIQRIKNKFSTNRQMLEEANSITNTEEREDSFSNSLKLVNSENEIASIDRVKIESPQQQISSGKDHIAMTR
jgi:hypothetical protein